MSNFCNRFFLISCKKYSEYFSRDLDGDILSKREKRNMNLHYFFCTFCRRYAKQLKLIDKAASCSFKNQEHNCCETLSDATKEKIKENLKNS